MSINPKHRAVFQTLITSVRTNLNATLTPEDSRIVLELIRSGLYRQRSGPIEIIQSASDVIDSITKEIDKIRIALHPGGPPPSERKE